MDELANFVGIKESVRSEIFEDPMIRNYFEYEAGQSPPILKDRLKTALPYWKNVIRAPPSILSVIEKGVVLDFITEPPKMELKNNSSALRHHNFVSSAITELLNFGLIKTVTEKPKIISPLSVAENKGKLRLILDLSILNEYIVYERVKLEDQYDFFELSKFCKFVTCYDIKACYHQISMHKDFVTYLGFKWIFQGKETYFIFLVLPFGLCTGPRLCKKLFRPLVTRWRAEGFINVLFYDDGIIGGADYDTCLSASKFVFKDLMLCHILPNKDKSSWIPARICDWLGYTWNFIQSIVKVTDQREIDFMNRLDKLQTCLPFVTPRKVAKVIGSLISMNLVIGDKCLLYTRFLQVILKYKEWDDLGWDTRININLLDCKLDIVKELQFLKDNFYKLNSRSLCPKLLQHITMFGDAGEKGVGGILILNGIKLEFRTNLPNSLIGKSSTERELYAVLSGLQAFKSKLINSNLIYLTDSQTCDIICRRGSGKIVLQNYALKIDEFVRNNKINFTTAWVKRELNVEADYLSKYEDPDDWNTSSEFFTKIKILSKLRFTLDPFAMDYNTKCKKFYSRFLCPDSSGIDGLKFPWNKEVVWACPPPALALKTLVHFLCSKCKGVLIIPDWVSMPVTPLLNSEYFKTFVKNIWIFPGNKFLEGKSKLFNKDFKGNLKVVYLDFNNVNL